MIATTLTTADRYKNVSPALKKAISYLQSGAWKELPADKKRYTIHEGEVEALRMVYETVETGKWETHRKWADIQMLVSGGETILIAPADTLTPEGDYITEKDFQGYASEGKALHRLTLTPGQLMIFFPEDAHQPNLHASKKSQVDKVVVKVIVE